MELRNFAAKIAQSKKMSITKIVRKVFEPRQKDLEKHLNQGKALQEAVLSRLIAKAKDTEYGRNHAFATIKGYDDFIKNSPVNTYEELKGAIDRMRHGETDVLWPGRVKCMPNHQVQPTISQSSFLSVRMVLTIFTIAADSTL